VTNRRTLMDRLDSDGATGLDLSPGDPVAAAAASHIRALEAALRDARDTMYAHGIGDWERCVALVGPVVWRL
jgi:hypothetical protein